MPPREALPYARQTDLALLTKLIGVREVRRHYRGSLSTVFIASGEDAPLPVRCVVARELVKRWLSETLHAGSVLSVPAAVREYLKMHFAGQEHESFVVMFLDAQHRLLTAPELFRGTLTQTSVYPREVVKVALKANAAAVILAHNHPSGVAEPSQADCQLTEALKKALGLVDVRVLDHFIVAGSEMVSFAERGLI